MHPQFPRLFQPFQMKNLVLRNRMVVSGHFGGWWVDEGRPSSEFAAYIEERAKGGVGLFVIGATSVERGTSWLENVDASIVDAYRVCVESAHLHGMAIFAQLIHHGYFPLDGPPINVHPPTAVATQPRYKEPRRVEPSRERLHEIVHAFKLAAARSVEAGMDGVELHSHEYFLHAQMLNPLWNTRTDEYGGSLENRMRFLIETLTAMREAIGPDVPLGVRLKLDDMLQRGMDFDDYATAVKRLESLHLIDYINFTCGDGALHIGAMPRPEGEWLPILKKMRAETSLTLMHAGRIATPQMAEKALDDGITDFVCLTKSHIADPHFTRKAHEGKLDDIRYCTRCNQNCVGTMDRLTCVYNPLTSREAIWSDMPKASTRKRIVIVGGGPAGMEAAVTASQRGHEVIVLERADRVGGQVWLGAASPGRRPWARIAEFYERQSHKPEIDVRLNTPATPETVLAHKPDAVIIATGSQPIRPDIANATVWTIHEALAGALDTFKHVMLFDTEGFNRPIVVADYLSARGIRVDFVTPLLSIAPLSEGMIRGEFLNLFHERGVRFLPGHQIESASASGVLLRSVQTAEDLTLSIGDGFGGIVAAVGSKSVNTLAEPLRGRVPEVYVIGDASIPQTVEAATYQGARIGRAL